MSAPTPAKTPTPYMGMDNFQVRVVGAWETNGHDDLTAVLQMVLNHHGAIRSWTAREGALYLFWPLHVPEGAFPLLGPVDDAATLHRLVVQWLAVQPKIREIPESDADETLDAFEAWTDQWGHGGGDHYAGIAIKPRTRWLGK
jgi:hypothetical protein